jgi:hypothetical protein
LDIRIAVESGGPGRGDEHESLLGWLRGQRFGASVEVGPAQEPAGDARHESAIRVAGLAAEDAGSLAGALFGWMSVRPHPHARLVLMTSDGRSLEVGGADWGFGETAVVMADFIAGNVHGGEQEQDAGDDPGTDSGRPVQPDNFHIEGGTILGGNVFHGPTSVQGGSHNAHSTPPGPPFGDDDDEW